MNQPDITFCETITVQGHELTVSGLIYPGEKGNALKPEVASEIEIEEVRCGANKYFPRGKKLIADICAALREKWNTEGREPCNEMLTLP